MTTRAIIERKSGPVTPRAILQADVEWKAGADPGEVEGFASVFGVVDEVGDVVMPGAFAKTIQDWKRAAQPMPLIADHELSTDGVIGSITHLAEEPRGLRFKARFSRSDKAQRIRQDAIDGHLRGTSFTYEIKNARPGKGAQIGGKAVGRFLDALRVFEITISPFPINTLAGITGAKASTTPWSQFTQADYTPAQWARACLVDTGEGAVDSKARYKLPVREPSGALNENGMAAAAGALAGARGGMSLGADMMRKAARALVRLYGQVGNDPPSALSALAGSGSASFTAWLDSMNHATAITDPFACKAAVDELVRNYPTDDDLLEAVEEDAPDTPSDAADTPTEETGAADTSTEDDPGGYAVAFLAQGQSDGTPATPPADEATPALDIVRAAEVARVDEEFDALARSLEANTDV